MLKLVAVEEGHLEAIVAFLASFPQESRGPGYWRARLMHWWELNPAFRELPVRGWALVEGERVLGFWGAVPQKYVAHGKEVVALAMSTWRVDELARGASLQLLGAFVQVSTKSFAVNTTANEVVRKALRAFRFQDAPTCTDGKASYLFGAGRPILRALAPLLNLLHVLRRSRTNLTCRSLGAVDGAQLDALWQRTRGLHDVALQRDQAFYRWFCVDDRNLPKRLVGLYRGPELAAVACFCQRNWSGRRELELLDLWPPVTDAQEAPALARSVLDAARALAAEGRCDLIQLPHFTAELGAALRRNGLWLERANQRRHFFAGKALGGAVPEGRGGFEGDWAL